MDRKIGGKTRLPHPSIAESSGIIEEFRVLEGTIACPTEMGASFMKTRRLNAGAGDIQTLFNVGSVVGMSDAQLLERYIGGRGEITEVAFAALVDRHGAMVLRVCNDVLDNPHDAQDAAQVTF